MDLNKIIKKGGVMDKKKARIALRKSIKHWCLDIRRPFLSGDFIDAISDRWLFSGMQVKMYTNHCELCRVYKEECQDCPLGISGNGCGQDGSIYAAFQNELNIDTANGMIEELVECYKDMIKGGYYEKKQRLGIVKKEY